MINKCACTFVVPYFDEAKAAIEGIIETKKNAIKGKWKRFKVHVQYTLSPALHCISH